jgi:Sporulation and spore germination
MAVMAIALVAAGGGAYLWFRTAGAPQPVQVQQQETAPEAKPNEPFMATLYLPSEGKLGAAIVAVKRDPDAQLQAREAVAAVFAGDQGGKAAVLKELKLRALYLDATGTVYLDLTPAAAGQKEIRASVQEELLAVYALVNTVTQNFPEIRQVRALVDGREAQTLAGHIDLSRSFVKRMDLVRTQ